MSTDLPLPAETAAAPATPPPPEPPGEPPPPGAPPPEPTPGPGAPRAAWRPRLARGWPWRRRAAVTPGPLDRDSVLLEAWLFLVRERRQARRRHVGLVVLLGFLLAAPALLLSDHGVSEWLTPRGPTILAAVEVSGVVGAKAGVDEERVIKGLRRAYQAAPKAVVLRINSPGGAPYVAERITTVLDELKGEFPHIPLYAVIEGVGASAAYLIAIHADEIIAGRYSTVGSIGAVLSSWDMHRLAERVEVGKHIFASGRLKAMLDPFRPLQAAEAAKAQAIVDTVAQVFASEVQAQRGSAQALDMAALTTGEVWVGEQAVALGLVDRLGTLETLSRELAVKVVDFTVKPNPFAAGLAAVGRQLTETLLATGTQPVWR